MGGLGFLDTSKSSFTWHYIPINCYPQYPQYKIYWGYIGDLPTRCLPGVEHLPPIKILALIDNGSVLVCRLITAVPNRGISSGTFALWSCQILTFPHPSHILGVLTLVGASL